jgi:uncharacterized protein YPO0396
MTHGLYHRCSTCTFISSYLSRRVGVHTEHELQIFHCNTLIFNTCNLVDLVRTYENIELV